MKITLLASALFFLASCGGSSSNEGNDAIPAPVPFSSVASTGDSALTDGTLQQHIVFAEDIPGDQQTLLRGTLSLVDNFNGQMSAEAATRIVSLLGINQATRAELQLWLKERLKFLVRSDLSRYNLGLIFPNSRQVGLQLLSEAGDEDEENTGASNIGTALYMQTLVEQQSRPDLAYLILQVNESWVPVLSPRVGIMRIGPALFNPAFQVNGANLAAVSNSLQAIEVLFHEARHSDGNATAGSLGFPHVNCPVDPNIAPELQGQPACDDVLNGAYSVGAAVLRGLSNLCNRTCTAREAGVLQSIYLDRMARLVVDETTGENLDPSGEAGFSAIDFSAYQAIRLK